MKYLFYKKETNTKTRVILIYNVEPPNDLLQNNNYVEVENLEEPQNIEGKVALLYCNPDTKEVWYEYIDKPLTEKKIESKKIEALEKQVQAGNQTILNLMEEVAKLKKEGAK